MHYWKGLALLLLAISYVLPPAVFAGDGRIELNQASIEADGGFPYTIGSPGSYVLAGPLSIPAGTDGLVINSNNVSIDLNGFVISSTGFCIEGNCVAGDGRGITEQNALIANQVTITNGRVMGFASHCIRVGNKAHVSNVQVLSCGRDGISVDEGSVVSGNTITNTGQEGLELRGEGAIYAHNTISLTGLGGGDEPSVRGGKATAGNFCDDGNCGWVDTRRRFYLTTNAVQGNLAQEACATGFHMASLWEIFEVTRLRYDATFGETVGDSGSGPLSSSSGWVRTGYTTSAATISGRGNCNAWISNSSEDSGTVAELRSQWKDAPEFSSPWYSVSQTCDFDYGVWCVED